MTINNYHYLNYRWGGGTNGRKMTVKIDLTNSNPSTCCTYADDAVSMSRGSSAWDDFFGIYPVLFKDGEEVGRLNKNNFAQYENGSAADITSGDSGDVMIAFPRRGLKISTSGNTLTIGMTDNPVWADYQYYAHSRGSSKRDKFYIGAYKGSIINSRLRSLSGHNIMANYSLPSARDAAHRNGSGYEVRGFYQLTYMQAMYLLKYANLDSQSAVGYGYAGSGNPFAVKNPTGVTSTIGMTWGNSNQSERVKVFGLEDAWGNIYEWIDGCATDSNHVIYTATDNFNDSRTGYTNRGPSVYNTTSGFLSKPWGTSEMGFLMKENKGTSNTYFCDIVFGDWPNTSMIYGGRWNDNVSVGIFCYFLTYGHNTARGDISARLMYL